MPAALCPPDPGRLRHLKVPPLSLGALHEVLRERTGRSFARPMMVRVAELSGGNPFFALEVARSLAAHPVGPSVLPASLRQVVCDHFTSLGPTVRDALLVATAVADPRLELVAEACGQVDVADLLGPAEDAGVVELSDGRVRFTHPLLAGGFYPEASPGRRRALHRSLADLVNGVEERGRHRALAATGAEPTPLPRSMPPRLTLAGEGRASAAAELLELAIGLGAGDPRPARCRRRVTTSMPAICHGHENSSSRLSRPWTPAHCAPRHWACWAPFCTRSRATIRPSRSSSGHSARRTPTVACGSSISLELCMALPNAGRLPSALEYASIAIEEAENVR